jgi:ATP-dependent RNA helicase DeaD
VLFFSATMPRAIQDLIKRYTRDPAWIKIEAHAQNAPQVEQIYFEVDRRSKIERAHAPDRLLRLPLRYHLLQHQDHGRRARRAPARARLRDGPAARRHQQAQRDRVMDKFRRRGFEFLVATDVAARGLDVDDLEVVFNFDLPNDAEDYTHRIGRTGRAGRKGKAFTFVAGRELYKLQSMVRYGRS